MRIGKAEGSIKDDGVTKQGETEPISSARRFIKIENSVCDKKNCKKTEAFWISEHTAFYSEYNALCARNGKQHHRAFLAFFSVNVLVSCGANIVAKQNDDIICD